MGQTNMVGRHVRVTRHPGGAGHPRTGTVAEVVAAQPYSDSSGFGLTVAYEDGVLDTLPLSQVCIALVPEEPAAAYEATHDSEALDVTTLERAVRLVLAMHRHGTVVPKPAGGFHCVDLDPAALAQLCTAVEEDAERWDQIDPRAWVDKWGEEC